MRALLALAIAATLVATACGSKDAEPDSTLAPAEAGYRALVSRADMRGGKLAPRHEGATLVTVFASWCGPCREELQTIGELREAHDSLRVIGINAYEDFDNLSNQHKLTSFLDKNAPWLTVVRDPDKSLIGAFGGVPKIPTSFVFDGEGRVVAEFRRDQRELPTRAELEDAIKTAAKKR